MQVGQAKSRFDERGRLTDEPTHELLREQLVALREWALRVSPARAA